MKELIIMRHAKSDWDTEAQSDFNRPLNERGKLAAPIIAQEFINRNIVPDKIFSSTAIRAKETAKLVAKKLNSDIKEIEFDMRFYFGVKADYIHFIQQIPNNITRALIIGHNPHVENIVNILAKNKEKSEAMPTAAAAYFVFETDQWSKVMPNQGLLNYILKPKEL